MKFTKLIPAILFGSCAVSSAAITVNAGNGTAGTASEAIVVFYSTTTPGWDSAGATNAVTGANLSNLFLDANNNGTFGEAGENSGNDSGTTPFTLSPTVTTTYTFAVEDFGAGFNPNAISFTVTREDSSFERINLVGASSTPFTDSTGQEWEISSAFNVNQYDNVVFNLGTGINTGEDINTDDDHQVQLTFTQVPEPSSAMLLGLAMGALGFRRKR